MSYYSKHLRFIFNLLNILEYITCYSLHVYRYILFKVSVWKFLANIKDKVDLDHINPLFVNPFLNTILPLDNAVWSSLTLIWPLRSLSTLENNVWRLRLVSIYTCTYIFDTILLYRYSVHGVYNMFCNRDLNPWQSIGVRCRHKFEVICWLLKLKL